MKFLSDSLKKFKWYVIGLIGVLVIILVGMAIVGSQTQISNEPAPQLIEQTLQNINPNYRKDIGLLPSTPFYFLKSWKEGIVKTFKIGETKKTYIAKLSQKRSVEIWLMTEINNKTAQQKALNKYNNLIQQIAKGDYTQQYLEIKKAYDLISWIQITTNNGIDYQQAVIETWKVIDKYSEKPKNLVSEEWIEGKVVEIEDDSIIIDWNSKKILVGNMKNAIYQDKNGAYTENKISDIKIGDKLAIKPIKGQVTNSINEESAGYTPAEIIIIGGK